MLNASVLHYAAAHEDAGNASQRLHQAIVQLSGRPVSGQKVADLVVTCFDRAEFELVRVWRGLARVPEWWSTRFTPAAIEVNSRWDMDDIATSEEAALAFVAYELNVAGYKGYKCSRAGEGWSFANEGLTLCYVDKVRFEVVDPDHEARVAKSLEGLHLFGDGDRLESRLRDLPGLGNVKLLDRGMGIHSDATGASVVLTPGGMAKCLRKNVKDYLGVDLSQGASQECLALLFGFRDWNELVALANRSTYRGRPVTVSAVDEFGSSVWALHYENQMAGIWGFSQKVRHLQRHVLSDFSYSSQTSNCIHLQAVTQARNSCLDPVEELFNLSGWPLVDAPEDDGAISFAQAAMNAGSRQHV